jgi:hypothetical protein
MHEKIISSRALCLVYRQPVNMLLWGIGKRHEIRLGKGNALHLVKIADFA